MSLLLLPNASLWKVKIQAHFSKQKSIVLPNFYGLKIFTTQIKFIYIIYVFQAQTFLHIICP